MLNESTILKGFQTIDDEYIQYTEPLKEKFRKYRNKVLESHLKKTSITKQSKRSNNNSDTPKLIGLYNMLESFDKYKPYVYQTDNYIGLVKNREYCERESSRSNSKKNCMGSLDFIFKDIFSCRLFGKWVHPVFCGPKKKCFNNSIKYKTINTGKYKTTVIGIGKSKSKKKAKTLK